LNGQSVSISNDGKAAHASSMLSYIICLNYIKRYIKGDGGQIEMQNGHFVDVARRKKEEFNKMIR
jgi:hypothetical protein